MPADIIGSIPVVDYLRYWRNSLADEELMSGDSGDHDVTLDEIRRNAMKPEVAEALREEWKVLLRQNERDQTQADLDNPASTDRVPVMISAGGLSRTVSHGMVVNKRQKSVFYTLRIPAVMDEEGRLCPGDAPWLGREFLTPYEDADEGLPVVGEIQAFDRWIAEHPLEESTWGRLMTWCEDLWSHMTGGREVEGFVILDMARIGVSTAIRGPSQHLCQLYDAVIAEEEAPALLKRACVGRDGSRIITRKERLLQFSAPRGSMGAEYGMAESQADAVAAYAMMPDHELLAVNGPPGTGKTTLLQSIIATEVVRRAVAGGDPAVIVGVSTNNQAVANINRSLNDILKENRSGDRLPWARRWMPDAETYGLYLPSNKKAADASARGFAVAVKAGNEWLGFPERERDEDYITRASERWDDGFSQTFGHSPSSIEAGLTALQNDLQRLLAVLESIKAPVKLLDESERWWNERAGDKPPEEFIDAETERLEDVLHALKDRYETAQVDLAPTMAAGDDAIADADTPLVETEKMMEDAQRAFAAVAAMNARLVDALSPHGIGEHIAAMLPIGRVKAAARKCARALKIVSEDAQTLGAFSNVLGSLDPEEWLDMSARLKQEADDLVQRRTADRNDAKRAAQIVRDHCSEDLRKAQKNVATTLFAIEEHEQLSSAALDELYGRLESYDTAARDVAAAYAEIAELYGIVSALRYPSVVDLDALVDRTIRHELFQKAMRYWEGRWILEARKIVSGEVRDNQGKAAVEARFRRWCMLTPCLVSTLHLLPKHFRFNFMAKGNKWIHPFLYEYVDVMIVDESGQVAPHVGMAGFAMAKRAVVVGDIYQIEPVVKATLGADRANSWKYGLQDLWTDGQPLTPHLVSDADDGSPRGSLMRIAQAATIATSPNMESERGIFLSEHRRCLPEIVEYCNSLVYSGRLNPMALPRKSPPPVAPMAWAHVRGSASKSRGSNSNPKEARAITGWLAAHANKWIEHYGKPIEEIVAIVTPFKGQEGAIRGALSGVDQRFRKLTVGTVHSLQGAERPIVIFSPTYNADTSSGRLFFDRKPNMMNVAVSRAKDSFVVIGDMRLFRRPGRSPSSTLGHVLFKSPENELADVDGNHQFAQDALVRGERVSTLARHREILRGAISDARRGQTVFIASPWISLRAIEAEGLDGLCAKAVGRGTVVHLIIDREWLDQSPGYRSEQAIRRMREAGAKVTLASFMHNKTVITGNREIIEGSFNWLSANRGPGDRYIRHETSWRISGQASATAVAMAIKEFVSMGVRLDTVTESNGLVEGVKDAPVIPRLPGIKPWVNPGRASQES